jgi:hypothetical protein
MPSAQANQDEDIKQLLQQMKILTRLMASQNATDGQNRQRVTVDMITAALTLATVTTVGSVTSVVNLNSIAGEGVRQFEVPNRNAVANCIRERLVFT